jgi:hypothetical protein
MSRTRRLLCVSLPVSLMLWVRAELVFDEEDKFEEIFKHENDNKNDNNYIYGRKCAD